MNTEMQKRALAARDAHMALLELKKMVDEATQTTHAVELEAVHRTAARGNGPRYRGSLACSGLK